MTRRVPIGVPADKIVGETCEAYAARTGNTPATRVFRRGPPPHVGWWLTKWSAILSGNTEAWRWWNRNNWSCVAFESDSPDVVVACARTKTGALTRNGVEWSDYWPENARVPRVDPGAKV